MYPSLWSVVGCTFKALNESHETVSLFMKSSQLASVLYRGANQIMRILARTRNRKLHNLEYCGKYWFWVFAVMYYLLSVKDDLEINSHVFPRNGSFIHCWRTRFFNNLHGDRTDEELKREHLPTSFDHSVGNPGNMLILELVENSFTSGEITKNRENLKRWKVRNKLHFVRVRNPTPWF